jgi:hypothetical protein
MVYFSKTMCTVQNPKLVQKFGTFAPIQFQIWNVPISSFMGARPSISESLGGVIFHMLHKQIWQNLSNDSKELNN